MKLKLLFTCALLLTASIFGGCTYDEQNVVESLPSSSTETAAQPVTIEAAEKNIENVDLDTDFPNLNQSDFEK